MEITEVHVLVRGEVESELVSTSSHCCALFMISGCLILVVHTENHYTLTGGIQEDRKWREAISLQLSTLQKTKNQMNE